MGSLMSLLALQDPTVPRTGSSCPSSWHRPSTVALPHAQPCVTVSLSSSSAMGKLWSPARQKCCYLQNGPGMVPDTEPSLVLQPSTWKSPASATLLPLCQPCGCWRAGGGGGEGRLQLPWVPMGPCSRSGHWDHETAARPQPTPVLLLQLLCAPPQHCIPHSAAMQPPQPTPLSQGLSPLSPHIPVPLMAVKPLHAPSRSGASLLCNAILTADTIYAFPFPIPRVPLTLTALAAHIWKGFSRALKKALIKTRLAAASAADLTLSTSLPCSPFPLNGQNRLTVASRAQI